MVSYRITSHLLKRLLDCSPIAPLEQAYSSYKFGPQANPPPFLPRDGWLGILSGSHAVGPNPNTHHTIPVPLVLIIRVYTILAGTAHDKHTFSLSLSLSLSLPLSLYLSFNHPFIHPSIHPSIHSSIHSFIHFQQSPKSCYRPSTQDTLRTTTRAYPSIHPSIHPSIYIKLSNQSVRPTQYQPASQLARQSINQSVSQDRRETFEKEK